jgi:hypothetical protein
MMASEAFYPARVSQKQADDYAKSGMTARRRISRVHPALRNQRDELLWKARSNRLMDIVAWKSARVMEAIDLPVW